MRQIWIEEVGLPEVLTLREAPDPEPGAGEVRVRVAAAGVNFADILIRMGLYPDVPGYPIVVGYEAAGEVDAVGPGVTQYRPGDRVIAFTRFGGYSDVQVVKDWQLAPAPAGLPLADAAALPVNYLTAWLMLLRLGNVQPGERVLIHSAGGGVGLAAVQLCRWRGAEVFGTASAGKHDRLRELGVAHCIDYRTEDFESRVLELTDGAGVQLVLDAVGAESFSKSFAALAPMGRLFMFGASSLAPAKERRPLAAGRGLKRMPEFKAMDLIAANKGVMGVNVGVLWEYRDVFKQGMELLLRLIEEGTIRPMVDRRFPFERAAEAHHYIQDRRNFGKVLLVP